MATKKTATRKKPEMKCTIKRRGHLERFDERKVYASIYSACLSAHAPHDEAEKIADVICKKILNMIKEKNNIDSNIIFKKIVETLKAEHEDAAFMYETHRDIS